jgi:hypothetical protein
MALVTCPECEAKISDSAAKCPKCGYPMRRESPQRPPSEGKSRLLLWLTLGVITVSFGCCALYGGVVVYYNATVAQKAKDATFSPLLELEFGEGDVPAGPKTLTTFQPKRAGMPVRVKFVMTDAYPFEIEARRYELFVPDCTLTVRRDNGDAQAIMAQTTSIDLVNVPFFKTAPLTDAEEKKYKGGYSRGSTGHMIVEFVPADTESYRVDFKGPGKGFKRYEVYIDQKGI